MSLSSFVKVGAVTGSVVGVISSAGCAGGAKRLERQDNDACVPLYGLAVACLISGPFVGSGVGAHLYGTKREIQYLRGALRPTPVALGIIMTTAISSAVAYKLGNGSNR